MRPSVVVAVVAAAALAGGGVATYELTRPADTVGVQFVTPAAQTATTEPTVTPTTVPTTSKAPVASKSTTRKATVRTKEGTVSEPKVESSTTPPAPDDPIRTVVPTPAPGNLTPGVPIDAQGTATSGSK